MRSLPPRSHSGSRSALTVAGVLLALLAAAALLGMTVGVYPLEPEAVLRALLGGDEPTAWLVLGSFRLPRLALALLIGGALGVAGALMQGALRNDLATPGLMGVQAGGQLGVVLTVALAGGVLPELALPAASLLGASLALALVLALSLRRGMIDPQRVILIGLAVSMAIGAATSVISLLLPMQTFDFMSAWLSGSLERANSTYLLTLAPWLLVLVPFALSRGETLNVLHLGEEAAIGLGVRVQRERLLLLLASTALASACSAVDGGIAFLGLLAPHIARRLVGQDYRRVIPLAALVGMVLLTAADTIGRVLTPYRELPAGVLVTAFGGPYFLWLLIRR